MGNIKKIVSLLGENTTQLGMHISTIETANDFLSDILEDFTDCSFMTDSREEEYKARGKLQGVITLIEYVLRDLNNELEGASKNLAEITHYSQDDEKSPVQQDKGSKH